MRCISNANQTHSPTSSQPSFGHTLPDKQNKRACSSTKNQLRIFKDTKSVKPYPCKRRSSFCFQKRRTSKTRPGDFFFPRTQAEINVCPRSLSQMRRFQAVPLHDAKSREEIARTRKKNQKENKPGHRKMIAFFSEILE